MSVSVCLSVCVVAYLENVVAELHQVFCACCLWSWPSAPLTALRYYRCVCRWRHIFTYSNSQWVIPKWIERREYDVTDETTASILTKFCSAINTRKHFSWFFCYRRNTVFCVMCFVGVSLWPQQCAVPSAFRCSLTCAAAGQHLLTLSAGFNFSVSARWCRRRASKAVDTAHCGGLRATPIVLWITQSEIVITVSVCLSVSITQKPQG